MKKFKYETYKALWCDGYELINFICNHNCEDFFNTMYKDFCIQEHVDCKENHSIMNMISKDNEDKKNKTKYLVLYNKEDIINFSCYKNECIGALIFRVYTNKNYRKMGYCNKAVSLGMKLFGSDFYYLYCLKENIGAISCYQKLGFVIDEKFGLICDVNFVKMNYSNLVNNL